MEFAGGIGKLVDDGAPLLSRPGVGGRTAGQHPHGEPEFPDAQHLGNPDAEIRKPDEAFDFAGQLFRSGMNEFDDGDRFTVGSEHSEHLCAGHPEGDRLLADHPQARIKKSGRVDHAPSLWPRRWYILAPAGPATARIPWSA